LKGYALNNRPPPSLSDLIFSAKIDYLSLACVRPQEKLRTSGRIVWPPSHQGRQLTIHDPTTADLAQLACLHPEGKIAELEVSVDISPKNSPNEQEHLDALQRIKSEYVAKGLLPKFVRGTNSGFRGAYQPCEDGGYKLLPFNLRVPGAKEQLLYGHRNDGVQVKVYIKGSDNRRALPAMEHRVRLEVRLGQEGLLHHGLEHAIDLQNFKFRSKLMPYFQHVHDTRPRKWAWTRGEVKSLITHMDEWVARRDQPHWESIGVGAFLRGGKRERAGIQFFRHLAVNDRIGQALHRLQANFSNGKFVCGHLKNAGKNSMKSKSYAETSKSAMTYSILPGQDAPPEAVASTGDVELDQLLSGLGS